MPQDNGINADHAAALDAARAKVQQPSQGRIVLVTTPGRKINGQETHAAMVTQVWADNSGKTYMVNATIFPGSGDSFSLGSIAYGPDAPEGYTGSTWAWPPRV